MGASSGVVSQNQTPFLKEGGLGLRLLRVEGGLGSDCGFNCWITRQIMYTVISQKSTHGRSK